MSIAERISAALKAYADPKRPVPPQGEVSVADPYSMYGAITKYNPSALISLRGYGTLDKMRVDDQVKAALAFKKNSVIASGWRIVAPEGKPDDWAPKVEIERTFWKLQGGFQRSIREILSALDYGFSVTEKVWAPDGDVIRLVKLATRKPHFLELNSDAAGNLTAVVQQGKELPLDKFVIYSYDYEFSNHYGRTDLEAAYRAWWTKNNAYKWMAMLMERLGIPPIFALFNANSYTAPQQEKLYDVLKSMQAASVGAIPRPTPDDLELWSPELAGQVSTVFKPALEMLNQDIARALLMPGLLGMSADSDQGSMARSKVHFDVFMLVLSAIREETQELVNHEIVDDILLYNYGEMDESEKPYFEWLPLSEEEKATILTQWKQLVDGKVVQLQDSDEAHVREALHFPGMDEEDVAARSERRAALAPISLQPGADGASNDDPKDAGDDPKKPDGEDKGDPADSEDKKQLTAEQFDKLLKAFVA